MSQNVTLPALISAAQSRRAAIEALAPCFPTPFTLMHKRSKYIPKTATSAILQEFGAPSRREGSFGKALRYPEIGHDVLSAGPFQTEWV
jgi:hypothetical protein